MQSMFQLIQSNAASINPAGAILPWPASSAVNAFTKIHEYWLWKRHLTEITQSEDALLAYGAGCGLNKVIGENLLGAAYRVPAQILYISVRSQESLDQYKKVCEAYSDCANLLTGHRTFHVKSNACDKDHALSHFVFDTSVKMWLGIQVQLLLIRVALVFKYTLIFIQEMFTLSQCLWSLREACSTSDTMGQEAKNKFILSTWKILDRMASNPDSSTKAKLDKQKLHVKGILTSMRSPLVSEVDESIVMIEQMLRKANPVAHVMKSPAAIETYTILKEQARDFAARLSFAFFDTAPRFLLTPPTPSATPTLSSAIIKANDSHTLPLSETHGTPTLTTLSEIQQQARTVFSKHPHEHRSLEGRATTHLIPV